ncbi:probable glycosyltransferase At5g20260 [Nymphaea colorata]|nr:probable glycosyltransferase At5g20260 [Nymphaea colorata]
MRRYFSAIVLFLVLAFSVAIFNSYSNSTRTTFSDITSLAIPATPNSSLNAASNAPTTVRKKGDARTQKRRLEKIQEGLARSRAAIRRAVLARNYTAQKRQSFVPRGPIYRNPYAFHQSYIEMEKRLKIWIYKEREPPIFHDGASFGYYAVDGHFMREIEKQGFPFVTNNPENALLFYLPFSIERMVGLVYEPATHDRTFLKTMISDYVQVISSKHPYWNRTDGADHFMVSCHDWAPYATEGLDVLKNFIRVLCAANTSEGYNARKDASLPEFIFRFELPGHTQNPSPPSSKTLLAFFAGGNHGSVRKFLFEQWHHKDPQIQLFERLPKGLNYTEYLMNSKYCLCPSGYEVASPRITESILVGCVPVPISDGYVLPFSDVLDWSHFSVPIPVPRIPEIKKILTAIPESTYLKLQANVLKVQKHFLLNVPPKRFDVMHMVLHSIWLRRLNLQLHDL